MNTKAHLAVLLTASTLVSGRTVADTRDPSGAWYDDSTIYISPMDNDELFHPDKLVQTCPELRHIIEDSNRIQKDQELRARRYFDKKNYAMAAYWFQGAAVIYSSDCNMNGFMRSLRNIRLAYCNIYLRQKTLKKERLRDAFMNCSRFKGVDLEALVQKPRANP